MGRAWLGWAVSALGSQGCGEVGEVCGAQLGAHSAPVSILRPVAPEADGRLPYGCAGYGESAAAARRVSSVSRLYCCAASMIALQKSNCCSALSGHDSWRL